MNVMNAPIYAIGVIIVSVCLMALAAFAADASTRSIIVGALIGYWFREGVSVTAAAKAKSTDTADNTNETN